jgi:hypothetical protein
LNIKYTLGFIFLLISTISSVPTLTAHAALDLDGDGVNDDVDSCPNLQEDYEGAIDGCPSNFVPWYDEKPTINSKMKTDVLIIHLLLVKVVLQIQMVMDLQILLTCVQHNLKHSMEY